MSIAGKSWSTRMETGLGSVETVSMISQKVTGSDYYNVLLVISLSVCVTHNFMGLLCLVMLSCLNVWWFVHTPLDDTLRVSRNAGGTKS